MAIEGLTLLSEPGLPNAARMVGNKFSLPPNFPREQFASRWAEEGNEVAEAQQDEYIESTGHKAVGWTVYQDTKITFKEEEVTDKKTGEVSKKRVPEKTEKLPVSRVVGKKKFILMIRPKALQRAVNDLYARTSRQMVNQELKGETNRSNIGGDNSILTNEDLRRAGKLTGEDEITLLPMVGGTKAPADSVYAELG